MLAESVNWTYILLQAKIVASSLSDLNACLCFDHESDERLLQRLASGALKNVAFSDMKSLAEGFGFRLDRVAGSHNIFVHAGMSGNW